MNAFHENTISLLESIEDCLQRTRILPCLTLVYAGIDVIASLEKRDGERTKAAFVRWVDGYLLKAKPLPCTALDLYAARCGVLHTFTGESDLLRKGKVRRILYAWGTAEAADLTEASRGIGRLDVAIHVRDLIDAFRTGLADYLDDVSKHPARQRTLEAGASLWFCHMDQSVVRKFLDSRRDSAEQEPEE
jgi:hypothetical protein